MIDNVPLIQNPNDVQQINASIIAMKKASRELDEKIVKLNSLNFELDKKIALLDSGLNKEIEDRKEAINSLDVSSVGGSGKYISAISETDGKISATAGDITSSVSSGNSQPVTSGGVASAINKVELITNGNPNNLYPSENNKIGYYQGTFTSNLPIDYRNTGILKSERVLRTDGTYTEIYQEYEVYGLSTANFIPLIFRRYGFYSGSGSGTPSWSNWTKLIRETDLSSSVTSGSSNPITSGGVFTALRGLETFYVLYGTPKSIAFSTWGSWLVIGNIDGSGNFGFFMTIASSYLSVQNLVTGTMGSYFLASVANNKITVGNGTHNLEITISGSTLTFTKTTSAGVHITIIGAGANIT